MVNLKYFPKDRYIIIFKYIFSPYDTIRRLQKENKQLKLELVELKDTNESLWDMLDELKKSEQEALQYYNLLNMQSAGDA